jgi:hypothetical protein
VATPVFMTGGRIIVIAAAFFFALMIFLGFIPVGMPTLRVVTKISGRLELSHIQISG